ncbi:MAG: hypothetical protein E7645_04320 [Ruminococcaceae bacterium]|nr:hypothetical protein [Oscillospiraceae bacterium]
MKKTLALIVAILMVVSMIPVMAVTTSAVDVQGDWVTYRFSGGYKEPAEGEELSYTPAPGYEYNDEGFHMTSADYTGTTPSGTIQSREKVSIKDGVYMELRIDQYPYGGEAGTADHWICFSIMDSQKLEPGNTTDGYGQGWQSLVRTPGNGGGGPFQSFVVGEGSTGWQHQGNTTTTPTVDPETGKEIYTFEITYDGTNYTAAVCGVAANGSPAITKKLNELDPNGEFYIGVSFHAGVADAPLEATILKFGTSKETATVPMGSDSELPEENINVKAPIADSSSIETNKPCLRFDTTETSYSGKIPTSGLNLTAQGDNSFKVEPGVATCYFTWGMRNSLSYEASDFPVIGIFVQDPNELMDGGMIYYCAGKNMSADGAHIVDYSMYDDTTKVWGENGDYIFMLVDMRELLSEEQFEEGWTGRINSLRFDFQNLYINEDPETDYFFFHYAGIFRSAEEAYAYQDAYAEALGLGEAATEEPDDPTEAPTDAPTDAPAASDEATDAPGVEGDKTEAPAATNAPSTTESGCASVIGSAAILLAAAAAAVVLKKRD